MTTETTQEGETDWRARVEAAEAERDKARAAAASDRGRAKAAEERLAALEAALRRHMPLLDERGTPLCGGCLEPAPCPDAALLSEEKPSQ